MYGMILSQKYILGSNAPAKSTIMQIRMTVAVTIAVIVTVSHTPVGGHSKEIDGVSVYQPLFDV